MIKKLEQAIQVMRGLTEANIYCICSSQPATGEVSVWVREHDFRKAQEIFPDVFVGKTAIGGKTVYFKNQ